MESALATLVLMIAVLFGVLTFADTYFTTQDQLWQTQSMMAQQAEEGDATALTVVQSNVITTTGMVVEFTLRNVGSNKVADFAQWDLILQHYNAAGIYSVQWLPYSADAAPGSNEWTIAGIYTSAGGDVPEIYEPGILNVGEEIVIEANVYPPIGADTVNQATLMLHNGYRQSMLFSP